ncbi:MAG: cyclic nucleotide-binding domain-containing protein [Leptospirales bacterium]
MNGPVLRTYKAGSIIYFIEDKGTDIFVLQKGRIVLISESLDNHSEVREEVSKGEFFGVKSALGLYPREETSQVLTDSTVLVFNPAIFQTFCMKNSRIVLQMLKVFSGELRKVHRKVRELLGGAIEHDNTVDLLKTAEYFYKKNEIEHAKYAFAGYLEAYKDSQLAGRAQKMLSLIESGHPFPIDAQEVDQELESINNQGADLVGAAAPDSFNPSDFSVDNVIDMDVPDLGEADGMSELPDIPDLDAIPDLESIPDIPDSNNGGSASIPDMPDMPDMPDLNDIPNMPDLPDLPDLPDVSLDAGTNVATASGEQTISELYYAGLNDFSQESWDAAISKYQIILSRETVATETDIPILEKTLYEKGRTHHRKGDTVEAFECFSKFVKKYPRSQTIKKAMISIGEIYEKKNDKNRAMGIYTKVTQMPPKDKESALAKQRIEKLRG